LGLEETLRAIETCRQCGATFERAASPGRPRAYCLACSPRDPAACNRAWRARNRDELNARRRVQAAERDAERMAERMAAGSRAIVELLRS
jgi:hypothetical protein